MKRFFSWITVICLLLSVLPAAASAVDGGSCGENVTWSISGDTLKISGSGAMYGSVDTYWGWEGYSESITKVSVSNGVTSIGAYAFAGLPNLKSADLPGSLDYIHEGAFYLCESLTSVTLPEGLLGIGEGAFMGTGLTSVKIPKSLTSLGLLSFSACPKLKKFTVTSGNAYFNADSSGALYNKDRSILHMVPGAVSGDYSVQSGVKAINHYAFYGCASIKSVYIPSSVVELGSMLFVGCTSMTRIKVSSSSEHFAHDSNGLLYNKRMNTLLTVPMGKSGTIRMFETVVEISDYAFYGCVNVSGVEFPVNLKTIGDYAFAGCTGLKSIALPDTVTSIGEYVFYMCIYLENAKMPRNYFGIPEGTFMECLSLNQVTFSNARNDIGDYAFSNCISLKKIEISSSSYIGECAFAGCINLEEFKITLVNSIYSPSLQSGAFAGCISLTDIYLGTGCTSIAADTLYGVTATIHYPDNPIKHMDRIEKLGYGGQITWVPFFYECESHLWDEYYYVAIDYKFVCDLCGAAFQVYISQDAGEITVPFNCAGDMTSVNVTVKDSFAGQKVTLNIPDRVPVSNDLKSAPVISVVLPESAVLELGIRIGDSSENMIVYTVKGDGTYSVVQDYVVLENELKVTVSSSCELVVAKEKQEELKNPFTDVGENNRFLPAILWAYYNGITAGKTATTFAPETEVTRAQFVTFLWRAAGEPEPASDENPFTDLPDGKYYTKAVLWAYHEGIAAGKTDTTFCPEDTCTRGQVVLFLYRYAGEPGVEDAENPFTDVSTANRYYKAIMWAYSNGITSGATETSFGINSTCIRAHVVTFLYRYLA